MSGSAVGRITAREFQEVERLRGPLEELFGRVFMILEDYAIAPELAEPGDLSDTELRAAVTRCESEICW
jgi:hypothetical protein